jgi:lipase (class 3)
MSDDYQALLIPPDQLKVSSLPNSRECELKNAFAIDDLRSIIWDRSVDWRNPEFCEKKNYAMSLFAALAYGYIFDFEINDLDRIKVVPSFSFQEFAKRGVRINFTSLRNRLEVENIEIIHGRTSSYFVFVCPFVIVVAIRGTVPTYMSDWMTNFNARKYRLPVISTKGGAFHEGFFSEVTANLVDLNNRIDRYGVFDKNNPARRRVYIAGHSLGGAIGAILHGLWSSNRVLPLIDWNRVQSLAARDEDFLSHSAYIYGAPRICDGATLSVFRRNFLSRNLADAIPKMPPSFLGYRNLPDALTLEPVEPKFDHEISNLTVFKIWLSHLRGYREANYLLHNHYIDVYRSLIGERIGIQSPEPLVPDDMLEPFSKKN